MKKVVFSLGGEGFGVDIVRVTDGKRSSYGVESSSCFREFTGDMNDSGTLSHLDNDTIEEAFKKLDKVCPEWYIFCPLMVSFEYREYVAKQYVEGLNTSRKDLKDWITNSEWEKILGIELTYHDNPIAPKAQKSAYLQHWSYKLKKLKIVAITGAGISAESGVKTFRDADGLWEGHNIMEVASPEGFAKNPALVLEFYNQRRRQLKEVVPNPAHLLLAQLGKYHQVVVVTQNVDDLHERAGSTDIIHLHGELLKMRGVDNSEVIYPCEGDILVGDLSPSKAQLRPHIVWFGESVPMIEKAIEEVKTADVLLVIGTSLQVYPAAGLIDYAPNTARIYYIDPNPAPVGNTKIKVVKDKASTGLEKILEYLHSHFDYYPIPQRPH